MANTTKIKTGELKVSVELEEAIWCDRKRWLLFGLPLTFTKYTLTASRLYVQSGVFRTKEDEIRLYRITDVTMTRSLFERMSGTGTLCLLSSDSATPEVHLTHIKNTKKVKEVLSQCIEKARQDNGVRTSELVGGGAHHFAGDGHNHPGMGPALIPDADQNGIDDRLE